MNKGYGILLFLIVLPLSVTANWFEKMAEAYMNYQQLTTLGPLQSSLIEDEASRHGLPENWQAYWLDEPVFGTRMFLAAVGRQNAPVILLVHGLGQNGLRDWTTIVPALEKHYRVVLIDLPGFANSPPPSAKLSPTRYSDLLHLLRPLFSSEPVIVAGHSMGAAVALRYAHRYPGEVSQLALIDAAGILQRTAFIKHSATGRLPVDPQDLSGSLLAYAVGLQDYGNALIEDIVKLPDPTVLLGSSEFAWGAALGRYPNINAALALIEENFSSAIFEQNKPVSILWGGKDPVAPLRTGRVLDQNLVRGRLEIIPDAGHVPMTSHASEVSEWLLQSLREAPDLREDKFSELAEGQIDYNCDGESGGVVSGAYSRMTIHGCTGLILKNVTAREILVSDSLLEIENAEISYPGISLDIHNSTVVMTAGKVHGEIAINASRLDIAGVDLLQAKPFRIAQESRLVMSVNRAANERYLHDDYVLRDTVF